MPITPLIGVRISWLMLARNSDLAREASIAPSSACWRASSARMRALTSFATPRKPVTDPSCANSAVVVSPTRMRVPSLRR